MIQVSLSSVYTYNVLVGFPDHFKTLKPETIFCVIPQAAGLDDAEWFVSPQQREAALAACEAAAREALAAERAAEDEGAVYSGPPPSVSISYALRPFIDNQRIEWLAALDADNLRFMVDMEKNK